MGLRSACRLRQLTPRRTNPLNIFAAHEMFAFVDPSMATKCTVQFNLFAGACVAGTP